MQHVDNLSRYATLEECNKIPAEIQPMNETHQQFVQYAEIHQQYWQELLDGIDFRNQSTQLCLICLNQYYEGESHQCI